MPKTSSASISSFLAWWRFGRRRHAGSAGHDDGCHDRCQLPHQSNTDQIGDVDLGAELTEFLAPTNARMAPTRPLTMATMMSAPGPSSRINASTSTARIQARPPKATRPRCMVSPTSRLAAPAPAQKASARRPTRSSPESARPPGDGRASVSAANTRSRRAASAARTYPFECVRWYILGVSSAGKRSERCPSDRGARCRSGGGLFAALRLAGD